MGLDATVAECLAGRAARCDFDFEGAPADWGDAPEASPVVLYVAPVTDALKRTALGRVEASIDRETLWEVVGMSVTREKAAAKPEDVSTVEAWIEHLLEEEPAGITVIQRSDDPSAPNM